MRECMGFYVKGGIMPFFVVPFLLLAAASFAVEQEQPTPYDLIRPIYPLDWDTSAADNGGTVQSFSQFTRSKTLHNSVPKNGSKPQSFEANAVIPDTLSQPYRDAMNLSIGRIRINQAGYLPDDPDKEFYYISANKCAETFEIVDLDKKVLFEGGTFVSTGKETQSSWDIIASSNAATQEAKDRYSSRADGPSGTVCVGSLNSAGSLPTEQRLRVRVLKQYSSTFIISERVYSMVRDATLKFYGINRSGKSESWFHPASHALDGKGKYTQGIKGVTGTDLTPPTAGALQGGWYDCGDHLKESQTMAYAFMVLSVVAGSDPDRDDDNYAYNMGETVNTDGVPDILREAKHGADFFLRSYVFAQGIIDNMVVSVGNFGADHGWWGRPEKQDSLPSTLTGRGGPHERDLRLGELGSNISSEIAAGLAILSKDYAVYDKAFADSCLMVAEKLYDFAKNLKLKEKSLGPETYDGGKPYVYNTIADGWSSPAYNGNNESHDDLALAAVALHYATYEKTGKMDYLNDAVEDKTIGVEQESDYGFFNGGWMAWGRDGMRKSSKNTSWANAYTYTLYAFYKLLLRDDETGAKYGLSRDKRLDYAAKVALNLGTNLSYLSGTGSTSIVVPTLNKYNPDTKVSFGDLWYNMQTDQAWIYNRYQAGNIFEMFAYYEVTKDLEGINLPGGVGVQTWNADEIKRIAIKQLNYVLGVNPWDVSFLMGVGDKNDAHPHHRASNPEGRNMPGSAYKYNPPIGALFGGTVPGDINAWVPSNHSWEDYEISETCIDGTAMFLAAATVAIKEEDRNRAPADVGVEIRYVNDTSAIVVINQDVRGQAMILYSTSETGPFNKPVKDTVAGMKHEMHMNGLENGTTYYFKVIALNARSEAYTTKWLVDSTSTPFSFTTLASPPGAADIQNIKVCNLSADSAEIMWYTPNGQYESKVYWDTIPNNPDQMAWNTGAYNADVAGFPTSFHYVKIGGLKEKTTYYYCVESNGVQKCTDDTKTPAKRLQFTTPVERFNFDVSAYQYEFGGMDFLNINLTNNEERAFDSLTLRFYVTATPAEIEAVPGENNQPGSCPLLVDSDICQAYDEAGFNKPCLDKDGNNMDNDLRYNMRHSVPVRLDDTYNSETGTYDWYIPVPLAGTQIKSSSRMRLDIGFSSGIYQNGMCETLRTPAKKRFAIPNSIDWSWRAHTREEDGSDFEGMQSWPKDQGDYEQAPKNPYIVVYRKDEFVAGFSPSYQEMVTKKADYKITTTFDAPFDVSNGSLIVLDSATSTMHLRGNAYITESGFVTSIWVNGVPLTDEQREKAAVYDQASGLYMLDIPVKMSIGTNKVDVTIFAGPDPVCTECQENGGCAFVNRSYMVNFSKGDRTAGRLQLLLENGTSVTSPALTPMKFKIMVSDKDNHGSETVKVTLTNSRSGESVDVTLKRTDDVLGYFESDWLNAINDASAKMPNVSLLGGDTITAVYIDAEDDEDSTSQYFYANPTTPIPQVALLQDTDCNSTADQLTINFSGSVFDGVNIILDSVLVHIDSTSNSESVSLMVLPATKISGSSASLSINQQLLTANGAPSGKATIYMRENGVVKSAEIGLSDGIAPTLTSVAILENEEHKTQDTLKIAFSEPVELGSTSAWPLVVTNAGTSVAQTNIKVISATTSDEGKSWLYVIEGNTNGEFVKKDFKASIAPDFSIQDKNDNKFSDCNGEVTIIESNRPVPVKYANIIDFEGDGQPDEIYIEFVQLLREKDMLDTIDVYWGVPEIYKAFAKPEAGWTLDTVIGDMTVKYVTQIVDTTMTIVNRGTTCGTMQVPDTIWTQKVVIDSATGEETKVKEIASIGEKTVEDKSNCVTAHDTLYVPVMDTIGIDSVQGQHTVIRIALTDDTYYQKTSGRRNGNGMILPRQGPMGGFFDNNTATLYDKCAPVIVSAKLTVEDGIDRLKVTTSEPVLADSAEFVYYIERKRGGETGVYLESATRVTVNGSTQSYIYFDDAPDAVHTADSIRLAPMEKARFKDASGNLPTEKNPWRIVSGDASNTRFKVTMETGFSKSTGDISVYGTYPPELNEAFRITYKKEDSETIANLIDGILTVGSKNVGGNYGHGGPTFDVEISLPVLLMTDSATGGNLYDVSVKFNISVYDNMGQFINKQEVNLESATVRKVAAEDGTIRMSLEWLAQDGDAPISAAGKKIATGAYIAKFDFKSTATNVKTGESQKKVDDATKTFGFKRAKKK